MIHTIRELIENKSVLILGYGREGRSSLQRIKEAGSYSRIAIADMNHVQLEEGHPAELICGPDYQKCLDDFDVVFKSPGIVLVRNPIFYIKKGFFIINIFLNIKFSIFIRFKLFNSRAW